VADVTSSLAAVEREAPAAAAAGSGRSGKATRGSSRSAQEPEAQAATGGGAAALTLSYPSLSSSSSYSTALAQLRRQMGLFRNVLRYLGLVNEEAAKFADTTLAGEVAAPEAGHWLRVVGALGLSRQQMADAAALHACWQVGGPGATVPCSLGRRFSGRRRLGRSLQHPRVRCRIHALAGGWVRWVVNRSTVHENRGDGHGSVCTRAGVWAGGGQTATHPSQCCDRLVSGSKSVPYRH
jgi:hypothetical protein